jgi:toxin ParE1/3/4
MTREARWYDGQKEKLGNEFLDDVAASISLIKEFPYAASPIGRGYRRHIMRRFPFNIIYQVSGDEVYVVAVEHHSRKSRYSRSRR